MTLGDILISEAEIARAILGLVDEIVRDYGSANPLLVGVMDGAMCFLVDLMRAFPRAVDVATARVQSYNGTQSGTIAVDWLPSRQDIEGRDVLLVEDIVDTDATVAYLVKHLTELGAPSVRVCALLNKPSRRIHDLSLSYSGFDIPDVFVVGYGLDYNGAYRNLREVREMNVG